jgi:pantetheine-phosphate adenylyltransferase
MNQPRSAVYAGTFDPPTVGHLWMIEQGALLFPRLVVDLGVNPAKSPLFPAETRLEMLRDSVRHLPNVQVESFSNRYLIDFARERGAGFVLRGIRTESDYEYERAMRNINGDLAPGITTVFLMPPREIAEVSSSLVRSLVGPAGWEDVVRTYLPAAVHAKLLEAVRARKP